MTRPRLVTGARLRYDEVREEHLLLIPEGAVRLNPTAAEVLELCDGERSLDDIAAALDALRRRCPRRRRRAGRRHGAEDSWSMPLPRPSTLIAELSYQCPLHCPYCSNPLDIGGERYCRELETEHWIRSFGEARRLGVLQLALTGGEPMLRRDLVELCAGARDAGLYSSLITAGTLFTRDRAQALKAAGLDHVQISIQSPDAEDNDRIAGNRSFEKKIAAARSREGARLPADDQLRPAPAEPRSHRGARAHARSRRAAARARQHAVLRLGGREPGGAHAVRAARARGGGGRALPRAGRAQVDVLWVLPDFYEELPKPCMGGWGQTVMVIAPNGDVLPCQAASTIPGLEFANVRDHRWSGSGASPTRSRASAGRTGCRAVPDVPARTAGGGLGRLPLSGAAARGRRGGHRSGLPVLAPSRPRRRAREPAQTEKFLYRTMKRSRGAIRSEPSARRTAATLRRDTGTASRSSPSMISDSSPRRPGRQRGRRTG